MLKTLPPTAEDVSDLVLRLRRVVEPTKIYLFGSFARGDFGPESDLDILVVVPDGVDLMSANKEAYRQLRGCGLDVDVLYVNASHFMRHAGTPGYVFQEVLRDGREIYAAA